jgi:nucleoside phosphorylase/tetratricopeptide (TPR) repeat protein
VEVKADIGIVTALQVERDAILARLEEYTIEHDDSDPATYFCGYISVADNDRRYRVVLVMLLGMGNNEASLSTQRMIERYQPKYVFVVGIAGGVKGKVELGDVVVAEFIHYYELAKLTDEGSENRVKQLPSDRLLYGRSRNPELANWSNSIVKLRPGKGKKRNQLPKVHHGPIASGEKVIANQSDIDDLVSQCPKLLAVEMEGYGVAHAASNRNPSPGFLEVRGISDLADVKKDDKWRSYAADAAAAFVISLISSGNLPGPVQLSSSIGHQESIQELLSTQKEQGKNVELIPKMLEMLVSQSDNNSSLTDERHDRITSGVTFINQGKPKEALDYFKNLKNELWPKAEPAHKFRLLSNIGMANLALDQIKDASAAFLEALQYKPDDERAIANAAIGYVLQGQYEEAEGLVQTVLKKNPANYTAYAMRVQMAPRDEALETVINLVPAQYRSNAEVAAAIGLAALNRKSYDQAKEWFQTAINNSKSGYLSNIKILLAVALMEPIVKNFSLLLVEQITADKKLALEQAVAILTEVLGGDYPQNLHSGSLVAIFNRSGALRCLKRTDKAIRDIDIALEKQPHDPQFIKQRALLACDKNEKSEAITYLKKIITNPAVPEASILVAACMMDEGHFKDAREVLEKFETDNDLYKKEAKHLLMQLSLQEGDYNQTQTLIQTLLTEDPEDIFVLITAVRAALKMEDANGAKLYIAQAKASLDENACLRDRIMLADFLYELKYHKDAAKIYEKFVDATLDTRFTRSLLNSYLESGEHGKALLLCEGLLEKYGPLDYISPWAVNLYINIDELDTAYSVCKNYLQLFPNDISMAIHLARINYLMDNFDELDQFLDSHPRLNELSFDLCKILIQLYKHRNRFQDLFENLYELRKRFYNNWQAHTFYSVIFIEESNHFEILTSNPERVMVNTGILIKDQYEKETWHIIEDKALHAIGHQELSVDDSFAKKLLDKRIGDEVMIRNDSFGKVFVTVVDIKSRYYVAYLESLKLIENNPEVEGFRILTIQNSENGNLDSEFIKNLQTTLEQRKNNYDQVLEYYQQGKIPFGTFAKIVQCNPVELFYQLLGSTNSKLCCWQGHGKEFDESLAALEQGGLIVIDLMSLLTLHQLGIADEVRLIFEKFGIARSTLNLLEEVANERCGLQAGGFLTIGVKNGSLVGEDISSEQVSKDLNYLKKILSWAKANCQILSCRRALSINSDEREKRNEMFGQAFVDTMLIASESNYILYSDDQMLRYYAQSDSNVRGVWTQVVLHHALKRGALNNAQYTDAVCRLVYWGLDYTIVDDNMLFESAQQSNWKIGFHYQAMLNIIEDIRTNIEYALDISTHFIYKLYGQVLIPHERDYLILKLITALATNRPVIRVTEQLDLKIQRLFAALPIQQAEIRKLINIWKDTQPFLT